MGAIMAFPIGKALSRLGSSRLGSFLNHRGVHAAAGSALMTPLEYSSYYPLTQESMLSRVRDGERSALAEFALAAGLNAAVFGNLGRSITHFRRMPSSLTRHMKALGLGGSALLSTPAVHTSFVGIPAVQNLLQGGGDFGEGLSELNKALYDMRGGLEQLSPWAQAAVAGGLGIGAGGLGLAAYNIFRDDKKKPARGKSTGKDTKGTTTSTRRSPGHMRVDIPADKVSPEFYQALSRDLLFRSPSQRRAQEDEDTKKAASVASGYAVKAAQYDGKRTFVNSGLTQGWRQRVLEDTNQARMAPQEFMELKSKHLENKRMEAEIEAGADPQMMAAAPTGPAPAPGFGGTGAPGILTDRVKALHDVTSNMVATASVKNANFLREWFVDPIRNIPGHAYGALHEARQGNWRGAGRNTVNLAGNMGTTALNAAMFIPGAGFLAGGGRLGLRGLGRLAGRGTSRAGGAAPRGTPPLAQHVNIGGGAAPTTTAVGPYLGRSVGHPGNQSVPLSQTVNMRGGRSNPTWRATKRGLGFGLGYGVSDLGANVGRGSRFAPAEARDYFGTYDSPYNLNDFMNPHLPAHLRKSSSIASPTKTAAEVAPGYFLKRAEPAEIRGYQPPTAGSGVRQRASGTMSTIRDWDRRLENRIDTFMDNRAGDITGLTGAAGRGIAGVASGTFNRIGDWGARAWIPFANPADGGPHEEWRDMQLKQLQQEREQYANPHFEQARQHIRDMPMVEYSRRSYDNIQQENAERRGSEDALEAEQQRLQQVVQQQGRGGGHWLQYLMEFLPFLAPLIARFAQPQQQQQASYGVPAHMRLGQGNELGRAFYQWQ